MLAAVISDDIFLVFLDLTRALEDRGIGVL